MAAMLIPLMPPSCSHFQLLAIRPLLFPPGTFLLIRTAATLKTLMLALAAGYVVVESGCRGSDNQWDLTDIYYGKAPAAIVDLKAAVRYIRHNDEITEQMIDELCNLSDDCFEGGVQVGGRSGF